MDESKDDNPQPAPTDPSRPSYTLSRKRVLIIAAAVATGLLAVSVAGGDRVAEHVMARPLAFRLRAVLGLDPKLNPRVKAFALDDQAVAALGGTDLPLKRWARLLETLAAQHPHMILIDKTFAYPAWSGATDGAADTEADGFVRTLQGLGVPVVAKAFASEAPVAYAAELPVERYGISLASLLKNSHGHRPPGWLPEAELHLYGPEHRLLNAFANVGHDLELTGGMVQPMVNAGSLLVPHWTMFAGGTPSLAGTDLLAGDRRVPLDSDGRLLVNLLTPAACMEGLHSLAEVAAAADAGHPVAAVAPGDIVVILPELYAGGTDRQDTALGRLPSGLVQLALVNSAVSATWLSAAPVGFLLTLLLCLAGAGVGARYRRRGFAAVAVGGWLLVPVTGVATFLFAGVVVPWVIPATAFLTTALLVRGEAVRLAERRAALLRHDLHGILSPESLQSLDRPELHRLEATEQVVTIMFIDIVGFSRAAEKQTPREAFSSLKSLIDQLRRAVHEHGGVVDRTMGDGMLCVFGFDIEAKGLSPHVHAEQAVQCAAKIQRDNLKRMLKAHKTNQAVFPLRVGINTTGVYLGNLGDTERTDLTVIGNGVNFAQRLEAACDRHMAMIGASTRDLLLDQPEIEPMLRKRHIRVKHATELVEAYELDPFFNDPQLLLDGDEAYRQFIGIERNDVRNPVPYAGLIKVMTNYGDGEMINFSFDGFTIKLPEYYAKDVTISLRMDTADGALNESLERVGLASLVLEVRWARPSGDGYIHGCLIKNLNREQRENVINFLRDAIQRFVVAERRIA